MRYVQAVLPTDLEYVDLYCVSDIHRGNRLFAEKRWYTLLEQIQKDRHAYMIVAGDGVEAALKSVRFGETYATMRPRDERRQLTKDLRQVRDKILLILPGNHDSRAERDSDENVMERVAEDLGLWDPDFPDQGRFDPVSAVLDVQFGTRKGETGRRNSFTFYVTHGAGGGRRPGGKLNRMQELGWIVDGVDGYIMGHVHSLSSYIDHRYSPDPRNKVVSRRAIAYVIAGSMLEYGGYAETKMYAPNAVSMPILRLYQQTSGDPYKPMDVILPTTIRPRPVA